MVKVQAELAIFHPNQITTPHDEPNLLSFSGIVWVPCIRNGNGNGSQIVTVFQGTEIDIVIPTFAIWTDLCLTKE